MTEAQERLRCFVVSPIGEKGSPERKHADTVLKHVIRAALDSKFYVQRADDEANPGAITPQIVNSILNADLIVADISGANANVFYELAIAHGYDKPTVHIQNEGERVPFDIKDMRVIPYDLTDLDSVEDARANILRSAEYALKSPAAIETPLRGAQNFQAAAASDDPGTHLSAQILEAVQELRGEIRAAIPDEELDAELDTARGDIRSYVAILTRVAKDSRLLTEDLRGVVNADTSEEFDNWARASLQEVMGETDIDALNTVLFSARFAETRRRIEEMRRRGPNNPPTVRRRPPTASN